MFDKMPAPSTVGGDNFSLEIAVVDRRTLLAGGAAVLGSAALPLRASGAPPLSLDRQARDAWLYCVPLVEVATTMRPNFCSRKCGHAACVT